jgi:hypothetical protein
MRVINVVTIKAGVVDNIESFGVFEEQLSQEVVEKAEAKFMEIAKQLGWTPEDHYCETEDDLINEGYFECETGTWDSVCISWSDI